MPRMRRPRHPQRRAARAARNSRRHRHAAQHVHVRVGHRMLVALHLLHENLRVPLRTRPRKRRGDGRQGRQPAAQRLGHHGRRRLAGNHFIHAIRRNVDLNVILFNNEIYGLTKGQYSPTSKLGKITKTSPYGTVEKPFNPGELVIGAKGTFFARSVDMEVGLSKECMVAAAMHKGMSVVEVLQNCVIFNDKTHGEFAADKATRAERTVTLRHGEKMLFGADKQKGIVFENMKLKVVTVGEDGYTLDDVLTHDAHQRDTTLHSMLAAMKYPDYPVALGVIRAVEDATVYDREVARQVEEVKAQSKIHSVDELLHSGATWEIE